MLGKKQSFFTFEVDYEDSNGCRGGTKYMVGILWKGATTFIKSIFFKAKIPLELDLKKKHEFSLY